MSRAWSDDYLLGEPLIDAQHQRLFETIAELGAAVGSGAGPDGLSGILDTLERYVAIHFRHEEQVMLRAGYRACAEHAQLHRLFARELSDRASRLRAGDAAQGKALLDWLQDWWDEHVLVEDRRYSEELGLKPGGRLHIEWHDRYSVGNGLIDSQHRKLFSIINRLGEAIVARKKGRELAAVADELERYVAIHFRHEENKMRESGYPGLGAHSSEHRRFEEKLAELADKLRAGSAFAASTTLRWLIDWVGDHVLLVDHKYVDWLKDPAPSGGDRDARPAGGRTPPAPPPPDPA